MAVSAERQIAAGGYMWTNPYKRPTVNKPDKPSATSVQYDAMVAWWRRICDLLEGTDRMREMGEVYLPREPMETDRAYFTRLWRSHLYNGVEGAINKVVSYPFSRLVTLTKPDLLPEGMDVYLEDVDGSRTTLTQFACDLYEAMVALGHAFIFIDYTTQPDVVKGKTPSKQQEEQVGARAKWRIIKATDMLAWEIDVKTKLPTEVRFREVRVERREGKKWLDEEREYVRVFRADGTWELWRADEALKPEKSVIGAYLSTRPVDCTKAWADGFKEIDKGTHTFKGIPIRPVYAKKTGEFMSRPPFAELSQTNVEHWQSSSDQRNILRFARLAQKVISGSKPKDLDSSNVKASVHNVLTLTDPAAKAYYLEHSGAGISAGRDDLKDLEDRMRAQGLQPLVQKTVDATATGSMIDLMNVSTDAQRWIVECEGGLNDAIDITMKWADPAAERPEELKVQIYKDFTVQMAGSQDYQFIQAARQAGDLTAETALREMQRRNILSDTVDCKAEVERARQEAPLAMPGQEPGAMPGEGGMAGKFKLSAGGEDGHEHGATLDESGDGQSSAGPDGHVHEIAGGEVMPAGDPEHVHDAVKQGGSPADPAAEDEDPEADGEDEEDQPPAKIGKKKAKKQ